eukprot:3234635-Rhodomonas_salina.1
MLLPCAVQCAVLCIGYAATLPLCGVRYLRRLCCYAPVLYDHPARCVGTDIAYPAMRYLAIALPGDRAPRSLVPLHRWYHTLTSYAIYGTDIAYRPTQSPVLT